ncbi:MAG TPA: hypothetical protein VGD69_26245 [Herpetosiphonaceae bacterium]
MNSNVIAVVDDDDATLAPLLQALGYQILEKPFQPPRLLAQIEAALQRWPPTD